MKENHYDNAIFFEKYSQMDRSVKGLEGAGEWPALRALLPDLNGKKVLDLGCGYGWHCMYAAEQGAKEVVGIDLSEKMLAVAKQKTKNSLVEYQHVAIEDYDGPAGYFDVVLSSLALHYVEFFDQVVQKVRTVLKEGGRFVFSVEHPVFTAYGSQDWYYDAQGKILHFPVDRYYYEGQRQACFLGEAVTKYHKTLTTYIDGLLTGGFALERLVEPKPPKEMLSLPGMKDEMRRPMMLIVSAQKLASSMPCK